MIAWWVQRPDHPGTGAVLVVVGALRDRYLGTSPATEGDRPGFGAGPGRGPVRVVLPPGPHTAVTSAASINCCMACSPRIDREGQQPLVHLGGDLLYRQAHLRRPGEHTRSNSVV